MNDKMKIITKTIVDTTLKQFKEQQKQNKEFRQGRYKEVWEDMLSEGMFLDSDSWSEEVESLHSLLMDAAEDLGFNEYEIKVADGDLVAIMGEMHGQGYYGYIKVELIGDIKLIGPYLSFDDVVSYVDSGVKPKRAVALEYITRGLNAVESIEGNSQELEEIREYIKEHLY